MRVVNLACKEVKERHFSDNIKRWIMDEFELYNIKDEQVFVLAVDSAADITKAVKNVINHFNEKVARLLADENEIDESCFDLLADEDEGQQILLPNNFSEQAKEVVPDILQDSAFLMHCVAHKVQLAVNRFLWKEEKSTSNLINDAGKIVVKLRTPIARMKLTSEGLKQPKLQVETRWSSVYEMAERLLELKDFCIQSEDEPGFTDLKRSNNKWFKLTELRNILKLPAELTKQLQLENLLVPDFIYYWFSMMLRLEPMSTTSSLAKSLVKWSANFVTKIHKYINT